MEKNKIDHAICTEPISIVWEWITISRDDEKALRFQNDFNAKIQQKRNKFTCGFVVSIRSLFMAPYGKLNDVLKIKPKSTVPAYTFYG